MTERPTNPHCERTEDTLGESELRDLFSMEEDDGDLDMVVPTHSGEWRHDGGDLWRYWKLPDELDLSVVTFEKVSS